MLMAQDGTSSTRTIKVMDALDELRTELSAARNLPTEILAAAFTLTDWIAGHPNGIRRRSISALSRDLLSEPLSTALLGYADRDLVERASTLNARAIADVRAQISDARQFLPDLPFAASHLDGICDALVSLSRFFGQVVQVRRAGGGLVNERQGGAEVARTRTLLCGSEYCDYCHRPSQLYAYVHTKVLNAGLTCVSGPCFTSAASEVRELPLHLSRRFCDAHAGGSTNRWSKACSRNRVDARSALLSYRSTLKREGLFRPHSERIQRYVAEMLASRRLTEIEIPRLRAGYRHTAPITQRLINDVFAPLGLPQDWLAVSEDLCEISASPDGLFSRTSVDGGAFFEVSPDELQRRGWRMAFERCLSTLKSYIHSRSAEAWLTAPDPHPDPESPFRELPVADLSIVRTRTSHSARDIALAGTGPRNPSDPLLRISFVSPVWLSRVSLLGPELSRGGPYLSCGSP